jgi:hypothetical protein
LAWQHSASSRRSADVTTELMLVHDCDEKQLMDNCMRFMEGKLVLYCFTDPDAFLFAFSKKEEKQLYSALKQFEVVTEIEYLKSGIKAGKMNYDRQILRYLDREGFRLEIGMYEVATKLAHEYVLDWINGIKENTGEYINEINHENTEKTLIELAGMYMGKFPCVETGLTLVDCSSPNMRLAFGSPQPMNPSHLVTKKPRQSDLGWLIERFLDKEPDGGRAGLIRFLEEEHDAECLTNEKIRWTDPTGKEYKITIKTLGNKLSELKGKRKKQKP